MQFDGIVLFAPLSSVFGIISVVRDRREKRGRDVEIERKKRDEERRLLSLLSDDAFHAH